MEISVGAKGLARIDVLGSCIFRVRFSSDGEFAESGLSKYHVLHEPEQTALFEVQETSEEVGFITEKAKLYISRADGRVRFCNADGGPLLQNTEAPQTGKGFKVRFALDPEERIYGMGDVTRDRLNKHGFEKAMWVANVASYVPITFYMSQKGWGLLLNTTWRHLADVGCKDPEQLYFHANGGTLDYYLFAGESCPELLNAYTEVAGRPIMLPQWAYGLTYVCNQNVNAFEMLNDARTFRKEEIPCDVIGLEPGWMDKHYDSSVDKKWNPSFCIPYWSDKNDITFLGAAKRMGFKVSLWLCCEYDFSYYEEQLLQAEKVAEKAASANYEEDDIIRDVHLGHEPIKMDKITKEDEPWFEHLKKFVDEGVSAFKLDGAYQVNEHPDRLYGNGMGDEEMHNLYPTLYNKQMSLGFRDHTGRRSMIYSSGGYTGIQQYSATWAGDTGGGPKSMVSLLNHGLSGHNNTSCDMDLFSMESIHFGFLQPWSQICNWDYFHQPWYMGKELERATKEYAILRYRLMPYIYTIAHEAAATGMPMMRAMPLVYPELPGADDMLHQYMFGDSLLVGAFSDEITLPEGAWIDYWTGKRYEGTQTLSYNPPKGKGGALFVKEGTILPLWEPMDFIGEKIIDKLELHVYGGSAGAAEVYEDDGVTYDYLDGKYGVTHISFEKRQGEYNFAIATTGGFDGWIDKKDYQFVIHAEETPERVTVNGVECPVEYDGKVVRIAYHA